MLLSKYHLSYKIEIFADQNFLFNFLLITSQFTLRSLWLKSFVIAEGNNDMEVNDESVIYMHVY